MERNTNGYLKTRRYASRSMPLAPLIVDHQCSKCTPAQSFVGLVTTTADMLQLTVGCEYIIVYHNSALRINTLVYYVVMHT